MKKFFICLLCSYAAFAQAEDTVLKEQSDQAVERTKRNNRFGFFAGFGLGYSHTKGRLIWDRAYSPNSLGNVNIGGVWQIRYYPDSCHVGKQFAELGKGQGIAFVFAGINVPLFQYVSLTPEIFVDFGKNSKSDFSHKISTATFGNVKYVGFLEKKGVSVSLRTLFCFFLPDYDMKISVGPGLIFCKSNYHFNRYFNNGNVADAVIEKSHRITQPSVIIGATKYFRNLAVGMEFEHAFTSNKRGEYTINRTLAPNLQTHKEEYYYTYKQYGNIVRVKLSYNFNWK